MIGFKWESDGQFFCYLKLGKLSCLKEIICYFRMAVLSDRRGHKSKHHWSQLGGNWLVLVRDVVTHQVPRHKIWLVKARFAVTCQLYFSGPFWYLLVPCRFISFYNSSYGCKTFQKLSQRFPGEGCLPWNVSPVHNVSSSSATQVCLSLPDCQQGNSLSRSLPGQSTGISAEGIVNS